MPDGATLALAAAAGYLAGSIPFGLVLARAAGLGDIRKVGSGNIGATNVLRTGRKDIAFATLVLDGGKGAAAALLLQALFGVEAGLVGGFFAVLGHNFPVWLKFKGGKGVATTLGTLLALSFPTGAAACATWLVVAALFRISSLAALVSLAVSPLFAYFFATPGHAILAALLAVLAILRHRQNVARLLKGQEPRIGASKK